MNESYWGIRAKAELVSLLCHGETAPTDNRRDKARKITAWGKAGRALECAIRDSFAADINTDICIRYQCRYLLETFQVIPTGPFRPNGKEQLMNPLGVASASPSPFLATYRFHREAVNKRINKQMRNSSALRRRPWKKKKSAKFGTPLQTSEQTKRNKVQPHKTNRPANQQTRTQTSAGQGRSCRCAAPRFITAQRRSPARLALLAAWGRSTMVGSGV